MIEDSLRENDPEKFMSGIRYANETALEAERILKEAQEQRRQAAAAT